MQHDKSNILTLHINTHYVCPKVNPDADIKCRDMTDIDMKQQDMLAKHWPELRGKNIIFKMPGVAS